jgi:hypothetical protein
VGRQEAAPSMAVIAAELVTMVEAVIAGRDVKYLMMNAPWRRAGHRAIPPGLESPSVLPRARGHGCRARGRRRRDVHRILVRCGSRATGTVVPVEKLLPRALWHRRCGGSAHGPPGGLRPDRAARRPRRHPAPRGPSSTLFGTAGCCAARRQLMLRGRPHRAGRRVVLRVPAAEPGRRATARPARCATGSSTWPPTSSASTSGGAAVEQCDGRAGLEVGRAAWL